MAVASRPHETDGVPSAPAGRTIPVNGIALYVELAGSGPDVLLLHGFPDSHRVWRKQVPALVAAGFRVIAPDLRGYGESEIPPGGVSSYRIDILVADVVAILDALGVAKVRLVAHDWGAAIGWVLAIAHPDRVERYAALSVGHPKAYARAGLGQKLKGWYILVFQLRGVAEWLFSVGDFALIAALAQCPEALPDWRADLGRPGRLTAAMSYYRANLDLVLPIRPGDVEVPVLGVWSSRDVALVERQMTSSSRFCKAGFRYERIDGVGHWIPLEAPDRLNALLIDFLGADRPAPCQGNAP